MTEKERCMAESLNLFRTQCRKESVKFTFKEICEKLQNLTKSTALVRAIISVLLDRGYLVKFGTGPRNISYEWTALKASDNSEYATINMNSWETVFTKVHAVWADKKRKYRAQAAEATLTIAKCIAFLKANAPQIKMTEVLKCSDGSTMTKEY